MSDKPRQLSEKELAKASGGRVIRSTGASSQGSSTAGHFRRAGGTPLDGGDVTVSKPKKIRQR